MAGLSETMAERRPGGKRLWPGKAWGTGMRPMPQAPTATRKIAGGKSPPAKKVNDCDRTANPILVCSKR
jgi:hypothetical protein